MSEENVDIIKRGYKYWKVSGEIQGHSDLVSGPSPYSSPLRTGFSQCPPLT